MCNKQKLEGPAQTKTKHYTGEAKQVRVSQKARLQARGVTLAFLVTRGSPENWSLNKIFGDRLRICPIYENSSVSKNKNIVCLELHN